MSDKEYSLFSDKDLVAMAGHGDLAAEEYLLNKYSSLVRYEIRFLYIAGAEVEDLMQFPTRSPPLAPMRSAAACL